MSFWIMFFISLVLLVAVCGLGFALAIQKRKYSALLDFFDAEDQILVKMVGLTERVVYDITRFFNESLIAGIPELQTALGYLRQMRDFYRDAIVQYNINNKYHNRLVVTDFIEEEKSNA